ncbi:hypothetical protein CLOP_g8053 [Closterium sp. NIES-67]|nr:hypothetical protein CLOP_g8053 [Closterium sp. NIES-67]
MVDSMVKTIEETRRLAPKVPVDTASFLTMAFYLGELREVLSQLNTKRDLTKSSAESLNGMKRLKTALDDLKKLTKDHTECSRLFLIFDTDKLVGDLQRMVQEVGHDLNLMPVLSIMSSLPTDVANRLTDLRGRMRVATFDSEPEVAELSLALEDGVTKNSKKVATALVERVLKFLEMPSSQSDVLKEEVQRDLLVAEKEERWMDVDKLTELKTLVSLASISSEVPITQTFSRLALRLREEQGMAVPDSFKCAMTGEVMRDPVKLVETGETYNRNAIENFFAKGKRACPKTGKHLKSAELVCNVEVRKAIEESYDELNRKTLDEAARIVRDDMEQRAADAAAAAEARAAALAAGGEAAEAILAEEAAKAEEERKKEEEKKAAAKKKKKGPEPPPKEEPKAASGGRGRRRRWRRCSSFRRRIRSMPRSWRKAAPWCRWCGW